MGHVLAWILKWAVRSCLGGLHLGSRTPLVADAEEESMTNSDIALLIVAYVAVVAFGHELGQMEAKR